MTEIIVKVDVWCRSCGEGLCYCTKAGHNELGIPKLQVAPCEDCLVEAYDTGHAAGVALAEENVKSSTES